MFRTTQEKNCLAEAIQKSADRNILSGLTGWAEDISRV
jgi:hypothetical protein